MLLHLLLLPSTTPTGLAAVGLLILRITFGSAFVLHSLHKLRNPFGWMEKEGDPPDPKLMQAIAAVTEFAGGVATVLGLATPLASAMLAATMATAIVQVHIPQRHPFIAPPGKPSAETCVVYLAIALVLLTIGPGILSIDAFLRSR